MASSSSNHANNANNASIEFSFMEEVARGIPDGALTAPIAADQSQFDLFSSPVVFRSLPSQAPTLASTHAFPPLDRAEALPSTSSAGFAESLRLFSDATPLLMGDAAFESAPSTSLGLSALLASGSFAAHSSGPSSAPSSSYSASSSASPDSGRPFRFVLDESCPCPPALPGKPFFLFPTHVRSNSSPVEMMNATLAAFHDAPWAIDSSIKAHKFKIKSFAFVDGHQVVFTARMYALPATDDVVVELQRCTGSKVAFRKIYTFVEASLAEQGMVVEAESSSSSPAPSSPRCKSFSFAPPSVPAFLLKDLDTTAPIDSASEATALVPLQAMLTSEDVSCQREAAACMASLSADCVVASCKSPASTDAATDAAHALSPSLFVQSGALEALAATTKSASDSEVQLACAATIANVLSALAAQNAIATLTADVLRVTASALSAALSVATTFEAAPAFKGANHLSSVMPANAFPETVEGSMSHHAFAAAGTATTSPAFAKARPAVVDLNRSVVARSLQLSRECARGIQSLATGAPTRAVSRELLDTCRAALVSASAVPDRKLQAHVSTAFHSLLTA